MRCCSRISRCYSILVCHDGCAWVSSDRGQPRFDEFGPSGLFCRRAVYSAGWRFWARSRAHGGRCTIRSAPDRRQIRGPGAQCFPDCAKSSRAMPVEPFHHARDEPIGVPCFGAARVMESYRASGPSRPLYGYGRPLGPVEPGPVTPVRGVPSQPQQRDRPPVAPKPGGTGVGCC